ncbi:hypothetical protein C8R43DRAFT_1133487 [Mycena crocata]|nr:hypothetical protein C8R43DRAFT_1133487 [Mycena crocata]
MAQRRPCKAAFFPDSVNFEGRKPHDESKRKMYFVVPWKGIFTKMSDALVWVDHQDEIDPALTMKKAVAIMDAYCVRHHQHGEVVPDSEDERSATPAANPRSSTPSRPPASASPSRSTASMRRSPSKTTPAPSKSTSDSMPTRSNLNLNSNLNSNVSFKVERKVKVEHPTPAATNIKIERASVKREELKREVTTPSPKRSLFADDTDDEVEVEAGNARRKHPASPHADIQEHADGQEQDERDSDNVEHMLSLYLDDEDDDGANVAETASRKRSVSVPPRDSQPKRARGGHFPSSPGRPPPSAPAADISPTISSVSSLSTASYTSVAHPFRDLGESASTARRGGAPASPRKNVPSPPVSAPIPRGTSSPRRGSVPPRSTSRPASASASSAPRKNPTIHLGPSAMRYKPAELKKIVEDHVPGSPSAPVLINNTTRTIYRDTEMAVREMTPKETVKVVDLHEIEEYVSARRWAA